MDPISTAASIITVLQLSAKVLAYFNDVKDASKDRVKCAIETSNLYNLLLNLRFRLEEGSSLEPWYTAVQALAVENGPLDQFKQALEMLQVKMMEGSKLKKAGEALVWKFKKEEVVSIIGRMERLKTLVVVALEMDHFKLSQAIKNDQDILRIDISTVQSGLNTMRQNQNDAQHYRIMAWLSPSDYPAQQSDIISRRQEGTGQWFLDAPEVARWLSEPKKTLFCPGIPGAGKTMIAAIAIDYLLREVQSSTIGVAYMYCNYKAQKEQDVPSLLAAFLKQLVQAQPSTAEPVEQLHRKHADRGTKPSVEEILEALKTVVSNYTTVHVVVDALDECADSNGTRGQFLLQLRNLQAMTDLRLMTTSRLIPDVVEEFREAIILDVRARDQDVRRFVAGHIYRLPKCVQRDSSLQDMVQDKVAKSVDGMFLLARLHIDSLLDKRTKTKVQSTLETLSKGSKALDTAYEDAIERIRGQLPEDTALASRVLSWITHAQRALTTEEIRHALAVKKGEDSLNLDNLLDIEDIVSVCAGLVTVDEESNIIRLVHYTTQEYFERIREKWNPSAQLDITSTCLTYLCFDAFKRGECPTDQVFENRLEQNVFLDYAAKHWGQHAVTVQDKVYDLACSFLLHDGLISSAMQAVLVQDSVYEEYSQQHPKQSTGLHVIARFRLPKILEELFSRLGDQAEIFANARDGDDQTPLLVAARDGHDAMVKLLLDTGAKVNAQVRYCGNALQVASRKGHEYVVKLLLEQGAEVNAQGGIWGNALQGASCEGHEQVVKLLLDKSAEVNAHSGRYGSALQAASWRGHGQVVKLLLDKGAEVNAQGGLYGNALHVASLRGHEQVVRLLLDKGAEVNAQGGSYGNALQAATVEGNEQVVKLLLDKGADINAQGGRLGSALQAASHRGHKHLIKLLLDKGADINAQGGRFGSALQAASCRGHEQVVELLLDKGADINMQGGYYGNALQAASYKGHEEVVKLLLDKGAEINVQGGDYGSALQVASYRGHEHLVKLLLDKGAEVNAQSGDYGTALQAASFKGHEQVVKLLISSGAVALK